MQPFHITDDGLGHLPPPFFPDEATEVPRLPFERSNLSVPTAYLAPELTMAPAKPVQLQPFKALRIARAKTGETELRLLARATDKGTVYIVRKATLAPYAWTDTPVKGKKLTEARAIAEFDKTVAATYPAVELRKDVMVPIHIDLL